MIVCDETINLWENGDLLVTGANLGRRLRGRIARAAESGDWRHASGTSSGDEQEGFEGSRMRWGASDVESRSQMPRSLSHEISR
jgi:hypothetical protein